jgi:hypothetical protein
LDVTLEHIGFTLEARSGDGDNALPGARLDEPLDRKLFEFRNPRIVKNDFEAATSRYVRYLSGG